MFEFFLINFFINFIGVLPEKSQVFEGKDIDVL